MFLEFDRLLAEKAALFVLFETCLINLDVDIVK